MKLKIKNNLLTRICQLILGVFIVIIFNGIHAFFIPSPTVAQSPTCGSRSGGPTDNPVGNRYAVDASWSFNIKWNCVYNINDFPATSVDESFKLARDAASANGGGIVYFTAGTYNFSDNIFLKDGVVIRGENPSVADAKSSNYNPPSKLIFPQYIPSFTNNGTPNNTAFKKILTANPARDSNIGVVNVDINRAAIEFTVPGNFDANTNQNIIVFGVRSNNVAEPDAAVPQSFQHRWQRFSDRFAANIKMKAFQNVLIANNRLNDATTDNFNQPNYIVRPRSGNQLVTYTDGSRATFNYTDHYGIILNRSRSPVESGREVLPNQPERYPSFFRRGLFIQDNWIYHTMRVAIHASGDGLVIKNNQIKDARNKLAWIDPAGTRAPGNSTTFENRAIDWSGWNVLIEGNDFEVYRHRIMPDGRYESVDGEGILIQECCGGTSVNGVRITQNKGNSYIGIWKVPIVRNAWIIGNEILENVTKTTPTIYVSADTNKTVNRMDGVYINQNRIVGSIFARASLGGSNNHIEGNRNISSSSSELNFSCGIQTNQNFGFNIKPCTNTR